MAPNRLTLKSLKADLDVLRADFEQSKATVLAFIATHSSPPVVPPVVLPPPSHDPNDPGLFIQPAGNLNDPAFRDFLIELASERAYGEPANQDRKNYWTVNWPGLVARGIQIEVPDYGWKRMIGWQATGADKAKYGPYA